MRAEVSRIRLWRITTRTWIALFTLGLALWWTIRHMPGLSQVLVIAFGAILLDLAMRPIVDLLAQRHVPRWATVVVIYLALFASVGLAGSIVAPAVVSEISSLQAQGPALVQSALTQLRSISFLSDLVPSGSSLVQNISQSLSSLFGTLVSTVTGIGSSLIDIIVVFVLAFFTSLDGQMGKHLLNWVPRPSRAEVRRLGARIAYQLARWVWAQLGIAVYFGTVYGGALALIGVPYALAIGLAGGVLEIVPYLGGATALLLGILSALSVHPLLVLWVVLAFTAIVEIESHVLAPVLFGRVAGTSPAAILLALVVGLKVAGVVGVFFAVPTTVVLLALANEFRPEEKDADGRSNAMAPDEDTDDKNDADAPDGGSADRRANDKRDADTSHDGINGSTHDG
ncbi:MAG: AI-2E family transporter [Anaerolineae bacterium]